MRSLWLLLILAIILLLGWNSGFPLFFRASFLLASGLVLSRLWVWSHSHQVAGSLGGFPHRVQVGQELEVAVELRNGSFIPKPYLELRLKSNLPQAPQAMVVALPGRASRTWSLHLPCQQRGQFFIGPVVLSSRDPLGLFHGEVVLGDRSDLLVYPRTVDLAPALVGAVGMTGQETPFSLAGVTPPIRGVRDYLPGDSYSRIHWLSSARIRKLMSKELERESSQDAWLLLDLEAGVQAGKGEESTEEYGVTLAASLSKALLEAHRSVGLTTWGSQLQVVPPATGDGQFWKILEALSGGSPPWGEPLSQLMAQTEELFRSGSTLFIITPATPDSWLASLNAALRWGGRARLFLLDASSFDPGRPRPGPGLVSDQVTTYPVRKGELWRLSLLPG